MAIKTSFSSENFTLILKQYDLGDLVRIKPLAQGTVQTNYVLETTQGKYVFRYYENRPENAVRFEIDVLTYLQRHQFPCPYPIKNKQEAYLELYQNKPFALFEFMSGQSVKTPNVYQKRQLIQKIAELHQLTANFQSAYTPYRWNYSPDLCKALAQIEAAKINSRDADKKVDWITHTVSTLELPSNLPKGVCHADLDPSNIFFAGDEFVALLDFDDANETYLMFDLVGLIENWAWPHTSDSLDLATAADIVRAYRQHRSMATHERQHLYDVYKLSILIDCIWFFGRGSADDFYEKRKIDALTKLGREQFRSALFSDE